MASLADGQPDIFVRSRARNRKDRAPLSVCIALSLSLDVVGGRIDQSVTT